jgi:hypothetical protein
MNLPRRTIEELEAIYSLEESFRDVYVEGSTDQSFFRWFLDQSGLKATRVYVVEDIEISAEAVTALGLDIGNRGRVVALAHALERIAGGGTLPQATCVVDRDLDRFLSIEWTCTCLLFTDYTSLEMYVCNNAVTERFVRLYCGKAVIDPTEVISQVIRIAEQLFALRLARKKLGLSFAWGSIHKSLELESGEIRFDERKFVYRMLSQGGSHNDSVALLEKARECRAEMTFDSRHQMQGHDYMKVFAFYFRKRFQNTYLFNDQAVAGALFLCADESSLRGKRLFRQLQDHITS